MAAARQGAQARLGRARTHEAEFWIWVLILALCFSHIAAVKGPEGGGSRAESFTEDMMIRPLPDGNVMYHFLMQTSWPLPQGWEQGRGDRARGGQHFQIFPKVLLTVPFKAVVHLLAAQCLAFVRSHPSHPASFDSFLHINLESSACSSRTHLSYQPSFTCLLPCSLISCCRRQ